MMLTHYIGDRIVDEIGRLSFTPATATGIVVDPPIVKFRKRRAGRGREQAEMRIEEGITVFPMGPRESGGTNERDDYGHRYVVSIASGTYEDDVDEDWFLGNWEELIRKRFHNRRLGDRDVADLPIALCGEGYCEQITSVRTGELPEWVQLERGLDLVLLEITVYVRENRGNG